MIREGHEVTTSEVGKTPRVREFRKDESCGFLDRLVGRGEIVQDDEADTQFGDLAPNATGREVRIERLQIRAEINVARRQQESIGRTLGNKVP